LLIKVEKKIKKMTNLISCNNKLHQTIKERILREGDASLGLMLDRETHNLCIGLLSLLSFWLNFQLNTLTNPLFQVIFGKVGPQ